MSDDVSNVNFVGGHAESQVEDAETALPADDREAAIAAVKAAVKAEGEKAAEEADEADKKDPYKPKGAKVDREDGAPAKDPKTGKFLPKEAQEAADDADVDTDTANVKQVLKQRQKIAAQKERQQAEFQKQQIQLQQAYAEVQRARQEVEREKARMAALKSDPVRAVREAGWDPEEFIVSLAKEGTEEGKMARLIRQQQEQLQEIHNWKKQQAEQEVQRQQQYQHQQQAAYRQSVEQRFLGHVSDEDKFPHVNAFYKGREASLVAEGDMVAMQYRELTGKEASLEDIAEYIEEVLAERSKTWYEKNKSSKVNAPKDSGKPARGATGKTLSASSSSDRRSAGGRDLRDLDGDDRLSAARDAVSAAIAASKARSEDD